MESYSNKMQSKPTDLSLGSSGSQVKSINLEDQFIAWMRNQTKPSSGKYTVNTINAYIHALKSNCKSLRGVTLQNTDLFYENSSKRFAEIQDSIRRCSNFNQVNQKAGNGAFSAGMILYERFLRERERNIADPSAIDTVQPLNDFSIINQNTNETDLVEEQEKLSNADFLKWFQPLIQALKDLGGSGSPAQVREKIIANCNLSQDDISQTRGKNNSNKFENDVAWARNYLKDEGYLDGSEHGVWKLTERGWHVQMNDELASKIFFKWVEILKCRREGKLIPEIDLTMYDCIMKNNSYTKEDFLSEVFISSESYDTLKSLLLRKKNIIFQGAPGVGKTFAAKRFACSVSGEKDDSRIQFVQFHQSYSYEDFVMGYRPDENGFSLKYGVFYKFCKVAENNPDKPYFFIIDEINRGNLSKIFGELLMLIECDKREQKVTLTYSETPFSVPKNLYIIGMMNTADRSLAMIDYALRRRFCFFELEPAFTQENFHIYLKQNGVSDTLCEKIINRMSALNSEIVADPNLGKGFRIGHSYFCDCKDSSENWYEDIIQYEVAPLLREYWFDDTEKAENFIGRLAE